MARILVTPLDWGLGHATRCIPVIEQLVAQGHEILLAGSGNSLQLLRTEYPNLRSFFLPAYDVVYGRSGSMILTIMAQAPKFLRAIFREHQVLEHLIRNESIDLVISDNRYGCWSKAIPSVLITHQTNILLPYTLGWLKRIVRWYNIRLINKFNQCWIPDNPGTHSLAGKLIRNGKYAPHNPIYIGNLSRFRHGTETASTYDVVFVLSGPEPQRSILEKMAVRQILKSKLRCFIVRGLLNAETPINPDVASADYLATEALQHLIIRSTCVVARSGYSTIMDLAKLGKKAIFIPTPGQTEQEYLAKRMKKMRIAYTMDQRSFDLQKAWEESKTYIGFNFTADRFELLEDVLNEKLPTLLPHATSQPVKRTMIS